MPDFFNELYVLELPSPGIHMNQACWFLMDTQPPRYWKFVRMGQTQPNACKAENMRSKLTTKVSSPINGDFEIWPMSMP